jgi:hypothetical protein
MDEHEDDIDAEVQDGVDFEVEDYAIQDDEEMVDAGTDLDLDIDPDKTEL